MPTTDKPWPRGARASSVVAFGSQITGQVKMAIGSFKLECQLDAPGTFSDLDATAFARRFAEIKPLYAAYLEKLRPHA